MRSYRPVGTQRQPLDSLPDFISAGGMGILEGSMFFVFCFALCDGNVLVECLI